LNVPKLTIGGVAAAAGVNVETIRYYQRRGLLEEPAKPPGGYGRYPAEMVNRIYLNERENIFGRIREALRVKAPVPGSHDPKRGGADGQTVSEAEAAKHIPEWLPLVGETFDQRVELFRENALELKAEFQLLDDPREMEAQISGLAVREGWKNVASHSGELTDRACAVLAMPRLVADRDYDVRELESCDAGISECEALIAQTGSVLVSSRSSGGRALSVVPPAPHCPRPSGAAPPRPARRVRAVEEQIRI
jgi:L-lactate dehydrogenase complex protein LldG